MTPTRPGHLATQPLRDVGRFWLVATALEVALAAVLLLTAADVAVSRGLDATGLPFSTDLVTAVRLCVLYPAATLGVVLAIAQVAAPDLAVAVVGRRTGTGPGTLRGVAALIRFRGPHVSRRAAAFVWIEALGVLVAASLSTAALNGVLLREDEHRWPALRTDLVPGLDSVSVGPELAGPVLGVVAGLLVTVCLDAGAVLEESGWRGYALPLLLQRYSPVVASLVLGIAWASWHYPVKYDAFTDYGLLGGSAYLAAFTLKIVLLTLVMTVFWQRVGGSTLLAVAMHGLSNDAVRLQGELVADTVRVAVLSELTISAPLALVAAVLFRPSGTTTRPPTP